MERVAESRRDTERRRNGLVILDAKYGRADAFTPRGYREANDDEGFPVIVDVTTSVQMLVVDSRLYVPAGRAKHGLNGFYDPCIGENKRLRVRYLFRGKTHEVTVDDIGSLLAPVQAHALDE
jgi:DnaJ family protein C protein 11